jgi:YD repeat-containing protein
VSMTLNGIEYLYIWNGQGDITGLINTAGTQVVSYTYDSWGKLVSIDGTLKDTVGLATHTGIGAFMKVSSSSIRYYLGTKLATLVSTLYVKLFK